MVGPSRENRGIEEPEMLLLVARLHRGFVSAPEQGHGALNAQRGKGARRQAPFEYLSCQDLVVFTFSIPSWR
jgi:hypothetical protein